MFFCFRHHCSYMAITVKTTIFLNRDSDQLVIHYGFTHFSNVDTIVLIISKHTIHFQLHLIDSGLNTISESSFSTQEVYLVISDIVIGESVGEHKGSLDHVLYNIVTDVIIVDSEGIVIEL